jgi:hypothetical protein
MPEKSKKKDRKTQTRKVGGVIFPEWRRVRAAGLVHECRSVGHTFANTLCGRLVRHKKNGYSPLPEIEIPGGRGTTAKTTCLQCIVQKAHDA